MQRLQIPDLPDFDQFAAITFREVVRLKLVQSRPGKEPNIKQLQRWAVKGVRLLAGGPRYLFPTHKGGEKERLTTPAWCEAWNAFVKRVKAEDAKRQYAIR